MYAKLITFSSILIAIYFSPRISQLFYIEPTIKPSVSLFTENDLKLHNGIDKPYLYLSILGKIFDVTKGATHYGPGKSYNIFIGRDSTRSFITGKFMGRDADDRVHDLTPEELRSLKRWLQFYRKEYTFIGKLIGRYYDNQGKLTKYGKEIRKLMKSAEEFRENEDVSKLRFPPCNMEWDACRGTRVWCTNKSGGIGREWIGYPRKLYEPGSTNYRCACIETYELTGNLVLYEGCDIQSQSCYVKL